jgi:glutathione synthase/RimK-type ligase-like ATP-grasp enzyme
MAKLVVVESPEQWKFSLEEVEVISALEYLTSEKYKTRKSNKVVNLCESYQYLSLGYYVSLLAEARGHKVMPGVGAIQDFRFPAILREDAMDFDEFIQAAFRKETADKVSFTIYFGSTHTEGLNKLAALIFNWVHAPCIRVTFVRKNKWVLQNLKPVALSEIPEEEKGTLAKALEKYFFRQRMRNTGQSRKKYDLAILVNPEEESPPSDARAIQKIMKAADKMGFYSELITRHDFGKLVQFDALFIRETTYVNHHTFRFAKKAASLGLAVIDDPQSILKCTNKVYLYELLNTHKIPTPRSWVISRSNHKTLANELPFPFILKQPDGAFSKGVVKVAHAEDYKAQASAMFQKSDLLIAQEFLPTSFDWRVGVLDGEVLFVCKYYMANHHWQIVNWEKTGAARDGQVESIPVDAAPSGLLTTALGATQLIGSGLYGVDMKEVEGKYFVIEINDNPNIDAGMEDKILKDQLYIKIMEVFLKKIKSEK